MQIYNHCTPRLSDLELRMIGHIPPGGNWQSIPSGLSARVDQIRARSAERGLVHTTYYGRLRWDAPAYTISTFFTRSGNGCFIHPEQLRLISEREAARLQSFPDAFVFEGTRRAVAMQIGNAVPPLLGYAVGSVLPGSRVVDLFAGAGGLSFGLQLLGKKVVLAIESDSSAAETYRGSHPGAEVLRQKLSTESVEEVADLVESLGGCDIVVGGPPCQSFSTAGLRQNDERSTLVHVYAEAVARIRPRTFVMENVMGLKSFQEGRVLREVLSTFRACGYKTAVWDLRADQYGVPQRRHRLFIVGNLDAEIQPPAPIFDRFRAGVPCVTVQDAISDLPRLQPGEGHHCIDVELARPISEFQSWARGRIRMGELLDSLKARHSVLQGELQL